MYLSNWLNCNVQYIQQLYLHQFRVRKHRWSPSFAAKLQEKQNKTFKGFRPCCAASHLLLWADVDKLKTWKCTSEDQLLKLFSVKASRVPPFGQDKRPLRADVLSWPARFDPLPVNVLTGRHMRSSPRGTLPAECHGYSTLCSNQAGLHHAYQVYQDKAKEPTIWLA